MARQGLRWGPQLACLGHLGPFSSRSLAFRRVSQTSSRVYGGGGGPQSRASRSLGLEVTQCQFCPTLLVKVSHKPVSAVRRKQRREQLLPLGGILGTYRASFTGALVTAGPLKHAEVWCAAAGHARVHGGPQVSAPSRLSEAPPRGEVAGPGQSKAQCTWDFGSRRTLGTALRTRGPCPWGHGDTETEEDAGMRVRACAPVRCVWSQSCGRVRRVPGTSSDPSSSVGVLGPFLHLFHLRLGHPCPKVTTQGPPPRGQVGRARRAGRGHATAR